MWALKRGVSRRSVVLETFSKASSGIATELALGTDVKTLVVSSTLIPEEASEIKDVESCSFLCSQIRQTQFWFHFHSRQTFNAF